MFYFIEGNGLGFQLGFWVDSHHSISLEFTLDAHSTTNRENGTLIVVDSTANSERRKANRLRTLCLVGVGWRIKSVHQRCE